jgi:hypothetical protein
MRVGVALTATAFDPKMVCALANSLFQILRHHASPLNSSPTMATLGYKIHFADFRMRGHRSSVLSIEDAGSLPIHALSL